jgi:hypothetical protein
VEVLPQHLRVALPGLAIAEGREQRPHLHAAAAVAAAGEDLAEPLPPLGQAAVDLGLAEAGDLADLPVGVALGEEGQGAQLLRLQGLEGLAAAGDRFAALGPLGRAVGVGRDQRHPVLAPGFRRRRGGAAEDPLAVAPHRQRLVPDDGLGPTDQFARVHRRRFGEEDLQGALEGFVRIVGAEREAARGAA